MDTLKLDRTTEAANPSDKNYEKVMQEEKKRLTEKELNVQAKFALCEDLL